MNDATIQDLSVKDWDIKIDTDAQRGYFEWVGGTNEDEECAGGLWFDGMVLIDYDGVFALPEIVKIALTSAGYSL
jgi:hypothetical protein